MKGSSKSNMGTTPRRKYDEEFKQQAVAMVRNGQSVRSVARALGINENVIHQWMRSTRDSQSIAELDVDKMRRRIRQLEMERDILKKALSIFSRQT